MKEEIEQRIATFRAALAAEGVDHVLTELVLRNDCSILGVEAEAGLRAAVAAHMQIAVTEVVVVGSAKLGFSPKPGSAYKHFSTDSDIDVAIVSKDLYTAVWKEVMQMVKGGEYIRHLDKFKHYHLQGWIRPDLMPSSADYRRCRQWWEFFNELSGQEQFLRLPIRAGIYYDESFLRAYQLTGLSQLHTQLKQEVAQ